MLDVYQRVSLDAAPRRRYPSLVWRGILKLIRMAETAIADRNPAARHEALMRAQQLVGFMDAAFRDEVLPEAAPAVHELHRHMVNLLATANLRNDVATLGQARDLALALDETWSKAADLAPPDLEGRWTSC